MTSILWRALDQIGLSGLIDSFLQQKLDQKIAAQLRRNQRRSLFVFCDLAAIPLSFDICFLLATAEQARRERNFDQMTIVFVADETDPAQLLELAPPPHAAKYHWRPFLFNLGVEMTRVYPFVGGVIVLNSRRDAVRFVRTIPPYGGKFPSNYSPYRPDYRVGRRGDVLYFPHHVLNPKGLKLALQPVGAPSTEVDVVQRWLRRERIGQKMITITLRDTENIPGRNSNFSAWQALIDHYQKTDVCFVVLDDYFRLFEHKKLKGTNLIYFDAPLLSPAMRLALYEMATFNLFTANGPAILCMLSETARFAAFGIGCGGESSTEEDIRRQYGLNKDQEPPCFNANQRFIWRPDDLETLLTLGVELIEHAINSSEVI